MLVEFGATRVLCAASVQEDVPRWRRGSGLGWVTAEYAMLPRATNTRNDRESVKGRVGGRTHEISRLVGRALRACVDYKALGENTIVIDCDVLQADGGTRTAAITGGYVALADAVAWLQGRHRCHGDPLPTSVAAVSVGIVDGQPRLDLCYEEDSAAETDMNVVCTGDGDFVEVQGTAEREPFSRDMLGRLLDLAVAGCGELTRLQHDALSATSNGTGLTRSAPCGWCWPRATRIRSSSCAGSCAAAGIPVGLTGLDEFPGAPEVAETGLTFAENALLKARAIAAVHRLPSVADDSGLCVDVLNGMPGIFSARWSGRHGDDAANLALVLAQLADITDPHRSAHFACAAALALPDGREHVVEGRLDGTLTTQPPRHGRVRLRPDLPAQ